MITNKFLISKVYNSFDTIKNNQTMLNFENEKTLLNNKEYSDLYYKYNAAMFRCEKNKFLGKNTLQLEKECDELLNKFNKIKSKFKLISPIFNCKKCNDTGFDANGDYCHCFYKKLTDEAYNYLSITHPKLPKFSDDTKSEINEKKDLFLLLKKYAKSFSSKSKNLIISGQTGTGKTFLAGCIANEVENKNFNVIYLTAKQFNDCLLSWHIAKLNDKFIYSDIFTKCDLLIIDDLGTEPLLSNVTVEYIYNVISERIINSKPYIITTNLSQNKLYVRYGERIYSRLQEKNTFKLEFNGIDLRKN